MRFAIDSPLEGAVHCELVSKSEDPGVKFCLDLGWVLDDSGIVKHCFALIICRETVPLSLAAGPALSGLKPLLSRLFRGMGVEASG